MVLACLALGVAVVVLELVVVLPHFVVAVVSPRVVVVMGVLAFFVILIISLRFLRLLGLLLLPLERRRRVLLLCDSPPLVWVQK